jgi:hypothetical protein
VAFGSSGSIFGSIDCSISSVSVRVFLFVAVVVVALRIAFALDAAVAILTLGSFAAALARVILLGGEAGSFILAAVDAAVVVSIRIDDNEG